MVSSGVIAEQLGVTRRTVTRLATAGVLTSKKDDRGHFTFDPAKAAEEYEAYVNGSEAAGGPKDWNIENKKADTRNKRIKGDMLQLEYDEMRGRYHRSEFVRDAVNDLIFAVRSMVLALPGKLGPTVAEIDDVAVCVDAIKRECNALLEELASYEYQPEYYRERLRDAGGMAVRDDD